MPLNTLSKDQVRYLGTEYSLLSLKALKKIYKLVVQNLAKTEKYKLQPGDSVLIKNNAAKPFDPTYIGDYRIISIEDNQLEIMQSLAEKQKLYTSLT